jgi:hypothetical protein
MRLLHKRNPQSQVMLCEMLWAQMGPASLAVTADVCAFGALACPAQHSHVLSYVGCPVPNHWLVIR